MSDSPSLATVPSAYWVRPGHLAAGPYPGAWTEDRARVRLRHLLDLGITFLLDLTEPGEMPPYEPLVQNSAITYRRMAIPDMGTPTPAHMSAILNTLDAALESKHTVYVHCLGGIGRTGTVIGCFLVRHGLDGQAALDEIVRLRGQCGSPETDAQFRMVRTWSETL